MNTFSQSSVFSERMSFSCASRSLYMATASSAFFGSLLVADPLLLMPPVLSSVQACQRQRHQGEQAAAPAIGQCRYSFYSSSSVLFLLVIVVFLRHFSRLCFIFTVCQSRSGSSRPSSDRRVCTSRSGCTRYDWAPSSRPHPFCRLWHIFRRRRTCFCPPSSERGTPG